MNEFDLPPELAEVERRLAERPRSQPTPALRSRVLAILHKERTAIRGNVIWRIGATVAAAVLLGLNLALSLANHPAHPVRPPWESGELETAVVALRQKSPELTEAEAYRLAALARSTRVLPAAPALPKALDRLLPRSGEDTWDMP